MNPESPKSQSYSKNSSSSQIIDYSTYFKQKQQRQKISGERKDIELSVAHLYRNAQKASKQLGKTQLSLIENMNRKSTREAHEKNKEELKKLREEELSQLKNNNSLARYMSMIKREDAKNSLKQRNTQISKQIKERQKSDEKLKRQLKLQALQSQNEKNAALERSRKMGVELAKVRSLYEKQRQSSQVRNDLLQIENQKIQQEKQAIQQLEAKQQYLGEFYGKTRHQKQKYESLMSLHQERSSSFMEMYATLQYVQDQRDRPTLNTKTKLQSLEHRSAVKPSAAYQHQPDEGKSLVQQKSSTKLLQSLEESMQQIEPRTLESHTSKKKKLRRKKKHLSQVKLSRKSLLEDFKFY